MAYQRKKRFNVLLDGKDIVVTLPKGNRKHLQEKIDSVKGNGYAWWDLRRKPTKVGMKNRVFIVCKGIIEGFFTIDKIVLEFAYDKLQQPKDDYLEASGGMADDIEMRIFFDDWIKIKRKYLKGFQGFRYRNFEYEEME